MMATDTPHTPIKPPEPRKGKNAPESQSHDFGRLTVCTHTQTGRRGGDNQDAVLATDHFFGVADGVGGGAYGEVASRVALEHCAQLKDLNADAVSAQVKGADRKVQAAIAELSDQPGATTLAAVWLDGYRGWRCHVGDARIYQMRPDWRGRYQTVFISKDQNYANMGLQIPPGGKPDDPACMLGTNILDEPEVAPLLMRARDLLLLCSDGLHRFVSDNALVGMIERGLKKKEPFDAVCGRLARAATANGGRDDISLVMVYRRSWINI